jgi:hypothetical protein
MSSFNTAGTKAVVGMLCSWFLVSCAHTTLSSAEDNFHTQVSYLTAGDSALIKQARAGDTVVLAQSQWGDNTPVQLLQRYFSAAGRECVSALVLTAQPAQSAVLCQYEPLRWGITRALTQVVQQ